ncbi:MAG: FecR domain-containing protein [Acidobacteria bacterium]|nr:FecR domain-containing protein [Acidobacteriota bacterium]
MVRRLGHCRALFVIVIGLSTIARAGTARAQEAPPLDAQAPAHISVVDGVAILERDGRIDDAPGSMPLLAGDRVRTRGGRVEILFADGSTLHLDHNSAIDLQSDELVRLLEGRLRLSIPGPARSIGYRIDGPHGWAQIVEPGDYRVALMNGPGGSELELAVIRGRAQLANDAGQTPLRAGERAFARGGAAPTYAYVANSAAIDAFDRWSEMRRDDRLSASAEYLPDEVRPYAATFEREGYWRDEPTYGRVWYPRVAGDWRPYYRGRWVSLRPYGWTWIAHDPWGWPTHHYGRWGYSTAGAWFWMPGRTWGSAWVSWASAPGYVSWCPLGWNNRPLFDLNINIGGRHDPWRAWTVIPQRQFGYGYVHRNVISAGYIDQRTRSAFAYRDRGPEITGYAIPRGAAPIRVAGTGPSRRGIAPLYSNLPADQGRIRTDGARIRVPDAAPASRESVSPGNVARERAVPTRPAVRSERAAEPGLGRAPDTSAARDAGDGGRRDTQRADAPRAQAQQPEARTYPNGARYEVYRGTPPRSERAADRPEPRAGQAGVIDRRSGEPLGSGPDRVERVPEFRRPAEAPQERSQPGGARPAPEQPRQRAVPRAEPDRRAGDERSTPQVDRRGPDRPPSGSYERRAPPSPSAAQPSAPRESGGRSSSPPAGARPRPSGARGGGR